MAGTDVFLSVKVTSKKKKINTFFFQCPGCWFEPVLSCSAVVCDEPEKTNAERSDFQEPPHTYRNVIHYQCRSGTLVGKEEIWCTENGRWSAPPPHCAGTTHNIWTLWDSCSLFIMKMNIPPTPPSFLFRTCQEFKEDLSSSKRGQRLLDSLPLSLASLRRRHISQLHPGLRSDWSQRNFLWRRWPMVTSAPWM